MAETPEGPPDQFVDAATGRLTQAAFRWLEGFRVNNSVAIGGILSGVSEAKSAAAAAQGTANGAVAGVSNLAGQTLTFSVSFSPAGASGSVVAPGGVTTNAVTVTPVGGTGPYTVLWTITGSNIGITDDTSFTTTFQSIGNLAVDEFRIQNATATVTDSLAATAQGIIGVSMYGNIDPGSLAP